MTKNDLRRDQAINATMMPENVAKLLQSHGINTVGTLMDTDAYKAVASGRYDLDRVREVNGIPVSAFRWMMS